METSFQPASIKQIARRITETKPQNSNQLKEIIEATPLMREELLPYNNFKHPKNESYGRRLMYENSFFCVYLMSWCPGDFTAIHDHGTTEWGCVLALDDFAHRLYTFENNKLTLKDDKPFLKYQKASVYSDVIHMMGNNSNNNALSLHIYGTNNPDKKVAQQSRIFYPEKGQMTCTQGAAFLFHPENFSDMLCDFNDLEGKALDDYLNLTQRHRQDIPSFKTLH
jgi:predicted metal-dependent enzyme (double-stranded beta helix superfamily)